METADEDILAAALEHGTTVLHANASTMTNSDSCHDWTGDGHEEQPFVTDKKENDLSGYERNLYLYHEETEEGRPRVATLVSSLANYSATVQAPTDPDSTDKPKSSPKLGTLAGVYFPCMQNIFGVILFIRMTWIIGTAGVIQGFCIITMCCTCTMLTAISMSAIATNGVVPAGGPYFMISRNLGPEFGGAIGLLFFIGTTFAASMYIVGGIEILVNYIAPQIALFGDPAKDPEVLYNNLRLYGTALLFIMGVVVYIGVKPVSKAAPLVLLCVILSIISIYVGIGLNWNGSDKLWMCLLGNRLLSQEHSGNCTKEEGSALWNLYCKYQDELVEGVTTLGANLTSRVVKCDPYFLSHNTSLVPGIRGLASGVFIENLGAWHLSDGQVVARTMNPVDIETLDQPTYNQVLADISTSFTLLVGIYFPSVTGIMAGCNRSGDLADAQRSIPIGTICAILTTSFVYISAVFLFGASFDGLLMRDKFGTSVGGSLVVANLAWPNEWVILIGSFMATTGAGLQSLISAPRLLYAISKDNLVPMLNPFSVLSASGEPTRALMLTLAICQFGVLLGNVDILAPLLSMFFLMLYGFINLACALQTLLRTPNWRPRFKYYHWSLSFIGASLCVAVMFMSSWLYALIAIALATIIYKYIEYRGAEKEWGDGISGLALSAARFSLLRLEEGPPHIKNWRPQILTLCKMNAYHTPKQRKLLALASQLKAGKGLAVASSILQGDVALCAEEAVTAKQNLRKAMDDEKVKGFANVLVAKDVGQGIVHLIQTTGLGGLKPNTVIFGWPNEWRQSMEEDRSWRVFVDAIHATAANKMALVVPKGIASFPESNEKIYGHIDVWWVVHDGGLLMLLPFLLRQHRTWRHCKMRLFTVAQLEDNSIQMKKDLKTSLYNLRIDAEVEVVEMMDSDISAYTYERTLVMEQRNQMLKEMQLNKRESSGVSAEVGEVQAVVDQHRHNVKVRFQDETAVQHQPEAESVKEVKVEQSAESAAAVTPSGDALPASDNSAQKNAVVIPTVSVEAPPPSPTSSERVEQQRPTPVAKSKKETLQEPDADNVRRMHTAVKLNEVIVQRSHDAQLVVLNLPSPPKQTRQSGGSNYMEFLEVLTEGLDRVLMVKGCGREVVTIYS
ncbi:solute carrier family 12 member 4-like isoform X1 [Daphnia carinata]|uniref:solute carrier family 12 member 4-like isoform X1 n=1 Tax=Daphnia carinata TaxID=120202 RepID=UPI0025796790|nr:solute carrier family 12 member 4-like isoform X1 [Daphnia carinata]